MNRPQHADPFGQRQSRDQGAQRLCVDGFTREQERGIGCRRAVGENFPGSDQRFVVLERVDVGEHDRREGVRRNSEAVAQGFTRFARSGKFDAVGNEMDAAAFDLIRAGEVLDAAAGIGDKCGGVGDGGDLPVFAGNSCPSSRWFQMQVVAPAIFQVRPQRTLGRAV